MRREHLMRDAAIIATTAYFCGQSFYIVFKMWSSLDFYEKVNAMETVFLTITIFCEALELLHLYKIDDMASKMFAGELFGMDKRVGLEFGHLASFRGGKFQKIGAENCEKFVEKQFGKTTVDNIIYENLDDLGDKEPGICASKNAVETITYKANNHPSRINILTPSDDDLYERKLDATICTNNEFFTMRSLSIIQEMQEMESGILKIGLVSFRILCLTLLITPLWSFVAYIVGQNEFKDLQMVFKVYIPFTGSSKPDNTVQYIGIIIGQMLYMYLFYKLSSDSFVVAVTTNATLKTEMKLFVNNLERFDAMFCKDWDKVQDDNLVLRQRDLRMWESFKQIVAHHQEIHKKQSTYNYIVKRNAIYIHFVLCGQLCISLFLLQGEIFFKVKYSVASLCLCLFLALYSEDGQDVEDGFEAMRDALYRISWHNMSLNLKRSLFILLTRQNLPPKVSVSHGIFVINRKNFSAMMRASYSYLNILNKIK